MLISIHVVSISMRNIRRSSSHTTTRYINDVIPISIKENVIKFFEIKTLKFIVFYKIIN